MKKGAATRQRIIEEAAVVFNQLGFGNTSMSDLMDATGLEKGGLYRHFSSKEELACEAFDYACHRSLQHRLIPVQKLRGGLTQLNAFITQYAQAPEIIPGGCPVFNAAVEHDHGNPILKKKAQTAYRSLLKIVTDMVMAAQEEGSLDKSLDAAKVATLLVSSLEGAGIAAGLMGQKSILKGVGESLCHYLSAHSIEVKMKPALYLKKWHSPIGDLFLYADESHLLALTFPANNQAVARRLHLSAAAKKTSPVINAALEQLGEYFAGKRKNFDLPLRFNGTDFQQNAWSELTRIPFGRTITYSEQAKRLKSASAMRAVGSANGKNPLAIVVPCHRVIGQDGKLSGYAGGTHIKEKLLSLEGVTLL